MLQVLHLQLAVAPGWRGRQRGHPRRQVPASGHMVRGLWTAAAAVEQRLELAHGRRGTGLRTCRGRLLPVPILPFGSPSRPVAWLLLVMVGLLLLLVALVLFPAAEEGGEEARLVPAAAVPVMTAVAVTSMAVRSTPAAALGRPVAAAAGAHSPSGRHAFVRAAHRTRMRAALLSSRPVIAMYYVGDLCLQLACR